MAGASAKGAVITPGSTVTVTLSQANAQALLVALTQALGGGGKDAKQGKGAKPGSAKSVAPKK